MHLPSYVKSKAQGFGWREPSFPLKVASQGTLDSQLKRKSQVVIDIFEYMCFSHVRIRPFWKSTEENYTIDQICTTIKDTCIFFLKSKPLSWVITKQLVIEQVSSVNKSIQIREIIHQK